MSLRRNVNNYIKITVCPPFKVMCITNFDKLQIWKINQSITNSHPIWNQTTTSTSQYNSKLKLKEGNFWFAIQICFTQCTIRKRKIKHMFAVGQQ